MTTVANRLHELTGLTGATMAQHLRVLSATGNTVATTLPVWSGLTGATMAQHLMTDRRSDYVLKARRWCRR